MQTHLTVLDIQRTNAFFPGSKRNLPEIKEAKT